MSSDSEKKSAPKRREFSEPGHFIGASDCQFFKHTHVGKWCISTIGDYRDGHGRQREIGYQRTYETYVFNVRSRKSRWSEVEGHGYRSAAAAASGHEEVVARYLAGEQVRSRR